MKPITRMLLLSKDKETKRDRDYRDRDYMDENYRSDRRRGREVRRYDDDRSGRMSAGMPYRQYPTRPYPPMPVSPGMHYEPDWNDGDWGDNEPYRDTNMGFMHHKKGYEFEMDGQAGDMAGYAKGRVYPMVSEKNTKSQKWKEQIEPLDEETAESWVSHMKSEDGQKGEHFTMAQTEQLMKQYHIEDVDDLDFFVLLNAMWTDYGAVARKFGVDKPEFYVCLSKAFLDDPDTNMKGAEKLAAYYEYIVK